MSDFFDVVKLFEKAELDSKSGALAKELLVKGETLYGVSLHFPGLIERVSPDGEIALGRWEEGRFLVAANSVLQASDKI